MDGITGKLADALSMFWQSLSDQERRAVVLGAAYLLGLVLVAPLERKRKQAEREELVSEVVRRVRSYA